MKMLCSKVFLQAKKDLGYDDIGNVSEIENINKRAVSTVNHIYRSIYFKTAKEGFKPLESINDYVSLPESVIYNCLIPGVASKIAFDYGDAKQQAYFADMYNQGLRYLNKTGAQIKDVLPSDYMNE